MRLLTVDYDQGAGGEWFARVLSQTTGCQPLQYLTFNTRTKVFDMLDQELLKNQPNWDMIKQRLSSADFENYRFHVVPCHRKTSWIKQHLEAVSSIRIQMPRDPEVLSYVRYLQINKALLTVEPNDQYFLGLVRDLQRDYGHPQFMRRVHRGLDNLSLLLLAKGFEDDEETRWRYLADLLSSAPAAEPQCEFDVVLPYEDLLFRPSTVNETLNRELGLDPDIESLKEAHRNYDQWLRWIESLPGNDSMLQHLIQTHKANYQSVINNA